MIRKSPRASRARRRRVPVRKESVSRPVLERLTRYYQIASQARDGGRRYISSASIAVVLGIDDTLVRKDMAVVGISGRPKVGFAVDDILSSLDGIFGLTEPSNAILIGSGQLAGAIISFPGFERYGVNIAAAFDNDFHKVGRPLGHCTILPMEKCKAVIEKEAVEIAILTVPGSAAQELVDWLTARGIRAIWNFAPVVLKVPPEVTVRNENLSLGLARLIHGLKRKPPTG